MLKNLELARADAPADGLSNLELLLILDATGDSLTRTGIRSLVREHLLALQVEVCSAAGRPATTGPDYVQMVDTFLSDLLKYAISSELQVAIAESVSRERRENLRGSFLNRMAKAVGARVLSGDEHIATEHALPQKGPSLLPITKGPALFATVFAFVFSNWIAAEVAQAGERPNLTAAVSGKRTSFLDNTEGPRRIEPAAAEDSAATARLQSLLASLDSEDAKERATAMNWLSTMGADAQPALPVLRKRLTLSDSTSRWEAAWLIANISNGMPDDVAALTAALADKNERVRVMVILALGRIGPAAKTALPAIVKQHTSVGGLASACP
jgi:hypothetical protein